MVVVPCWMEEDPACCVIQQLVDALMELAAPLPQVGGWASPQPQGVPVWGWGR